MFSVSKIFKYIWPHAKKHWVAFSLMFLGYAVGIIFDSILKPLVFKSIIDLFSSNVSRDLILNQALHYFLIICVIVLIHNVGFRVGDFATSRFESKVMKRLYDFTFEQLMKHSYHFFSNNFSGSIIAKSRRFTRSFETLTDIVSFQIWFSFITLSGILIILFFKIPILAYIFLVWSVFYILVTFLFIRKKIFYDKKEELNFKLVTNDEEKKRRKAWYFGNFQNIAQSTMMATLQITVLFTNIHFWYAGKISLGMFVLIQTYMFSLFDILWNFGRSLTKAMKAMTDMQEVVNIFDTPIDIVDKQVPEKLKIHQGHIIFKDVSFVYKGGISVFENFNLEIAPGERVGIVGHSGAGKSTITKILLRFADISNGDITIDGQNIKNVSQNDLRSMISYVPQESILFHRTIGENIGYSKNNATKEEIAEVAKKAHADKFISKLPKKYDTLVGERGVKLSGGERQRVAIARAMLKDSPILMLY